MTFQSSPYIIPLLFSALINLILMVYACLCLAQPARYSELVMEESNRQEE